MKGTLIYGINPFTDDYTTYSFSATYGLNRDEWQYMIDLNIDGVSYYFRAFTDGQINLAGDGKFDGWYEPL